MQRKFTKLKILKNIKYKGGHRILGKSHELPPPKKKDTPLPKIHLAESIPTPRMAAIVQTYVSYTT